MLVSLRCKHCESIKYIYMGGKGRGRETVREGEKEGKGVWKKTNINVNRASVACIWCKILTDDEISPVCPSGTDKINMTVGSPLKCFLLNIYYDH